jgi:hypothetical protein
MQELVAEKTQLRKAQKELKKQHVQLLQDKKGKKKQLADLDAKSHDVQVRLCSSSGFRQHCMKLSCHVRQHNLVC